MRVDPTEPVGRVGGGIDGHSRGAVRRVDAPTRQAMDVARRVDALAVVSEHRHVLAERLIRGTSTLLCGSVEAHGAVLREQATQRGEIGCPSWRNGDDGRAAGCALAGARHESEQPDRTDHTQRRCHRPTVPLRRTADTPFFSCSTRLRRATLQAPMSDDPPRRTLDRLARGFLDRTLPTAKLATRLSMKMAKRTFLGSDAERAPNVEAAIAAARELVAEMGELKGIVMKVGQMASYLPGALPPEAQRVLATLQADSIAMRFERIAEIVEAELGKPPDALFDDFGREAFAAASIGQVHRATLDGVPVAVKVQYPEIEQLLTRDLVTVGRLARLGSLGSPIDGAALVDELRERTLEECDYVNEAKNQRLFAKIIGAHEGCFVPDVFAERSSKRVLTTRFVEGGQRFTEFHEAAPREVVDRAANRIFATAFDSLFRHCTYNGDPHPGNYLFHEDGGVTFLDFGCVRHFDVDFIDTWKRLAMTVQDGDRGSFKRHFDALGMVANTKRFDYDAQWEAMLHLYRPMRTRAPFFTFSTQYVEESYGKLMFDNPNKMRMAMPRPWPLLNRLQWGLFAVLAHMRATAPWPDLFREALESKSAPAVAVSGP